MMPLGELCHPGRAVKGSTYICFPSTARQIEIQGNSEFIKWSHVFSQSFSRELP